MSVEETVTAWIDEHRDDVIDFVLEFGNVSSPRGYEHEASDYLHGWLLDRDVEARQQPVVAGRSNVIGTLPGRGSGDSLLFNAHIDTGFGDPDEDEWVVAEHHPVHSEVWREGSYLFGDDAVNDKGPMAAFVWAGLALKENGIELGGDVHMTATVGEIAGANVDEFRGPEVLGNGLGSRRLVDGGITADYAVVAETTDYAIGRMECGLAWFKVTITGDVTYQARIRRPEPDALLGEHGGALPKAAHAALELERWAYTYQQENTREYDHGTVRPSAGVGAIRSGVPFDPAWSPGKAALYVDVRLPPGERPEFVRGDVERVLADAGVDATVETYNFRRGYVADEEAVGPLVRSLSSAHDRVRGGAPPRPEPEVTSMWRDINVFNEVGIPAVTVGPPRSAEDVSGTKHRALDVDDLVTATKLYALTALEVCGSGS